MAMETDFICTLRFDGGGVGLNVAVVVVFLGFIFIRFFSLGKLFIYILVRGKFL